MQDVVIRRSPDEVNKYTLVFPANGQRAEIIYAEVYARQELINGEERWALRRTQFPLSEPPNTMFNAYAKDEVEKVRPALEKEAVRIANSIPLSRIIG